MEVNKVALAINSESERVVDKKWVQLSSQIHDIQSMSGAHSGATTNNLLYQTPFHQPIEYRQCPVSLKYRNNGTRR